MAILFKDFVLPEFETSFLKVTKYNVEKETEKIKNFNGKEKLKLARLERSFKKEKELYIDYTRELSLKYAPLIEASQDLLEQQKLNREFELKVLDFQRQESELDIKLDFALVEKIPSLTPDDIAILWPILVNVPPVEEEEAA